MRPRPPLRRARSTRLAAVRAVSPCALRTARWIGPRDLATAVDTGDDRTFIAGARPRGVIFILDPVTRPVRVKVSPSSGSAP